ncbi:MAG: KamA family radical SAM protein [Candidatus Altiarchaeota archaeon]
MIQRIKREDRRVALARSAEVKAKISDYLQAKDKIPTGLKLTKTYARQKEKIIKALGASKEDWEDYRWHLSNNVKDVKTLSKIINLTAKEKLEIQKTAKQYRWGISPHYASLMDLKDRSCPVRQQAVPSILEYRDKSKIKDPMIIKYNSPAPLISRLYPDRLIINVTNQCAMFCRHCLRRKDIGHKNVIHGKDQLKKALSFIKKSEEIRDVLLTGGDALALPDNLLDWILTQLEKIDHIEIMRLGSRMPVTLPQRVTPELCEMLSRHDPLYLNTQFNHPKEVTAESKEACDKLTRAGVLLGNQTVFMKGINNDAHVMKKLCHELLKIKVRPYYIFNCKKVEGIKHFRAPLEEGLAVMEKLRGFTSGLAVPTFIVTTPNGRGKTPLFPQYLLNPNVEGKALLRTWGGYVVEYEL